MKILSLLLIIAAQGCCGVFDWFETSSPKAKKIRQIMEEFDPLIVQALEDYQVPGLSIGIVADGQLVFAKGYGLRDPENELPATSDTIYSIGSCSKAFTSFIAGTLVDEGLIHWDTRIIDMYPEFRLFDDHATLHVTMRDLLTHRSGMPMHDLMWYNSSTLTRADVMHRLRFVEPSCDIREFYQYNNVMYLAAGFAMEYLMAEPWEELVSSRILKPLQMNHTSFHIKDMQTAQDYAVPHGETVDSWRRIAFQDISLIGPAGGINSNVHDLSKWILMHLNGGVVGDKSLISPVVLQEIHAPQVVVTGAPESKVSHIYTGALGWNVVAYRGQYYVSHDGGLAGYTSVVGFFPKEGIGIIVLSNKNLTTLPRYLSNQINDAILDLPFINWLQEGLDQVKKTKLAKLELKEQENLVRKAGTQPSHLLQDFIGDYHHDGYGTLSISEKEGKLSVRLNDLECFLDHWHHDVFVISEEAQDMFRSREGLKLSFHNGMNGEVEKLVIPFEPKSGDVVFYKKAPDSFSADLYLKQFVGVYEIYGYVVEIAIIKNKLCAVIPGQPTYELVPESKNEFSVKSLNGYMVRFVMNPEQKVDEVLLLQPYGAFSARPKT